MDNLHQELNNLKITQVKKSKIYDFLNSITMVDISDKILIDVIPNEQEGTKIVTLGRPPVLGSSKKQMRHVTPYTFVDHLVKTKISGLKVSQSDSLQDLAKPLKIFVSDQLGLSLGDTDYQSLQQQLKTNKDVYHIKIKNTKRAGYKYLIDDEKVVKTIRDKKFFSQVKIKDFETNYTKNIQKFIDYSVDILQQAIKDENTICISCEAIGRLTLTIFNQRIYTAFPEEGNTVPYEIRLYDTVAGAKDPKNSNFQVLTQDEVVELQDIYTKNPKIRIVNNEGDKIKKVISALEVINTIITLCNRDVNESIIETQINEYKKYDSIIKIKKESPLLLEKYNQEFTTDDIDELVTQGEILERDPLYYHIAKHLYYAFDFKSLEDKVLVPKNLSDRNITHVIKVFPSAEGDMQTTYCIKDGDKYREDQMNSAVGYNKKAVFRTEELDQLLLIKKVIDHVYISVLLFSSFIVGFKNSDVNYPKAILDAFSELIALDYSMDEDSKNDFLNNIDVESNQIKIFQDLSAANTSLFTTSGEVESAALYGEDIDFFN
ncbi:MULTISPECIES: hypothetical protein [Rickettsieae]|uniref:hypothetical protein n=1 Tax=Rickettsieae TaxID=33988 RepID=UPI000B9C0785|nr:hypothetical protein [Rickettsia endosymbiont of Culicoides newsteadi]OZG31395.1 hypothetical protein RiCNE_12110 [Rickettsia endosymbiont of Culicoides newsteadi]